MTTYKKLDDYVKECEQVFAWTVNRVCLYPLNDNYRVSCNEASNSLNNAILERKHYAFGNLRSRYK